jgi:hypothetical protein
VIEVNDYELLADQLDGKTLDAALKALNREGYSNLSMESKLAFIQGLKLSAMTVLQVKDSAIQAEMFSALIAAAGLNLQQQ